MRYQTILFDLDGTLTDPGIGITNSVQYALGKFGINVGDRSDLYCFIGGPLKESFERFYGFSPDDAEKAVAYYREYYAPRGIFENKVYEGIGELLQNLRDDGRTLLVATLKPTVFAVKVLEHFGLNTYFGLVSGPELDGTRGTKRAVIEQALSHYPESDRAAAVMVGDRSHDMLAAGEIGIDSVGVLYGYGSRDELIGAGAGRIAETVAQLSEILSA